MSKYEKKLLLDLRLISNFQHMEQQLETKNPRISGNICIKAKNP